MKSTIWNTPRLWCVNASYLYVALSAIFFSVGLLHMLFLHLTIGEPFSSYQWLVIVSLLSWGVVCIYLTDRYEGVIPTEFVEQLDKHNDG